MLITYKFIPESLYAAVHELIRMTYPGCNLVKADNQSNVDVHIAITMKREADKIIMAGFINESGIYTVHNKTHYLTSETETHNEINRNVRRFAFGLLGLHLGKPISTYGILTGVRPVKLVHLLIDDNKTAEEIKFTLENDFYLNPEKAALLTEVAFNNRSYLSSSREGQSLVSIYIGIPYCPTRCYYCSFPGAVLKNYANDITPFIDTLIREIEALSLYLKLADIKVQTIYIGGGTPTILTAADMAKLLASINKHLKSDATVEITVEAGRPDTLSFDKLKVLKDAGVTRVCINPQTMNDKTLLTIGRKHNEKEVMAAFELARQAGIKHINMDIIIGLPGEGEREYSYTAKSILKLQPENVTIHTLALKKGSAMAENEGRNSISMRIKNVEDGVKFFAQALRGANYIPYYLYRQKYMRGDMENVGFSKPNNFCLYNIQMMEERQTIIGLGGGSASKFYNPRDGALNSIYNPKDPKTYLDSMERLIKRKVDKLTGLN